MRILISLVFLSSLNVPSIYSEETKQKEISKKELQPFQGSWKCIEATKNGRKTALEDLKKMFLLIDQDSITWIDDNRTNPLKITQLDSQPTNQAIDFRHEKEKQDTRGIYRLDRGKLTICFSMTDPQTRPKAFESTEGSKIGVWIFERMEISKELLPFQGNWEVTELIKEGEAYTKEQLENLRIDVVNDWIRYTDRKKKPIRADWIQMVKLDLQQKPNQIDFRFPYEKTPNPAIFEFADSTLKICFSMEENKVRPQIFESKKDSAIGIWVWERAKK
jgi:uncharacterized protein (TIGR03067 family)